MEEGYLPRIVDEYFRSRLNSAGALLIEAEILRM
jgi:hypothetical protein